MEAQTEMQEQVRKAADEETVRPDKAQEGLEYVPPVEAHLIRSSFVRQTFKVQVMRPVQRREDTTRYPVVYATDGNLTFDMFKGISYLLQSSQRDAPRFILVGVGYPSDVPCAGALLRGRDLIFPGYPKLSRQPPPLEGVLSVEPGTKDFGGAEDFQKFIGCELIPFIDENYATIGGHRTYFGHSAGGGFGLFTLFTQSDLFRNYIVSSPGVIYHGVSSAQVHYENFDFVLQLAQRFATSGKVIAPTRMYMSVGLEEEFEPEHAQWQLTSSFYRLARLLKAAAIPELELTTEVFAGETHMTAWPLAFIHGIQAVFGTLAGKERARIAVR